MSLSVFLPAMAPEFGGQAGGAASAFLLAMSIANLPVGWAIDRTGARPVLSVGIILTAGGCFAAAAAQERAGLTAAMAVIGAGVGASTIVPGIAIITRLHESRRGLALALFLGATVVAGALIPPFTSMAIKLWSWRTAIASCGGAALACLPLVLLVPGGRLGPAQPSAVRAAPYGALGDSNFRRILIATIMLQLSINGILLAAVDGLMVQGLSQSGAVAAYSIANLLGLPALLLGGLVADRIGARSVLIGAALLLAVGTLALLSLRWIGWPGVALFVLLWGVASALPGQSGSMLLAEVVEPNAFSRLLGLNTMVSSLIGSLAPLCTDQMRAVHGGYELPVLVYAALALAASPIIALARPRGRPNS